ncbi:cell adhesion molecule 3-like [Penaeus vannamei]|uniref:cell adhesion molecule 3-like n=1 Tax=Penaeus vannamei TaxID=6689 RepID=UPI00387F7C3B
MNFELGIMCAVYCCTFSLATIGRAAGEFPSAASPPRGSSSSPYALQLASVNNIRGSSSSHLGMNLSGNSSSPVEPIKPLLDLGDVEGTLTLPAYPVFDEATPTNVTAMTGNAAYLHCLVHNLGNKSVSWIRQRDIHILTVGRYTYTTDERYEVIHSQGSKDWILKIKYAQSRDSGNYECQVSTKPVKSYTVHLHVFGTPSVDRNRIIKWVKRTSYKS